MNREPMRPRGGVRKFKLLRRSSQERPRFKRSLARRDLAWRLLGVY